MSEGQRIRILLVEDDDEDAAIFTRHAGQARAYDISLVRAADVGEGERRLKGEAFDVAFLDLNVFAPLSGMDLLKRMRDAGIRTPFIIVTGAGDTVKAVEAMKSGACDYLVKDKLSPELLDRAIRAAVERYALERERDRLQAELAELTFTDPLTGLANRRRLTEKLEEEIHRAGRTRRPFSVLMVDLDHFKRVNDRHGHQVGDQVLRDCAQALTRTVREIDLVSRYGGEEFCIVLSEADLSHACTAAERLRAAVAALPPPMPTISIGVAEWYGPCTLDSLLARSDSALYEAKRAGRNRVAVFRVGAPHSTSKGPLECPKRQDAPR